MSIFKVLASIGRAIVTVFKKLIRAIMRLAGKEPKRRNSRRESGRDSRRESGRDSRSEARHDARRMSKSNLYKVIAVAGVVVLAIILISVAANNPLRSLEAPVLSASDASSPEDGSYAVNVSWTLGNDDVKVANVTLVVDDKVIDVTDKAGRYLDAGLEPSSDHSYKLKVTYTHRGGRKTLESETITVTTKAELPPVSITITKQPVGGTRPLGVSEPLIIRAKVSDGAALSFQWYHGDGSPIGGPTEGDDGGAKGENGDVKSTHYAYEHEVGEYTYYCMVSSGSAGSVKSAEVKVIFE